ncbi:MAG: flagellar assembly protein FliH [Thiobacillaceae bacterium]
MTGKIIPKEQLTAYQRWELGGLDTPDGSQGPGAAEPVTSEEDGPVSLPTAEELERLHQAAWQEGYRLGLEEGRREGFAAGSVEARAYVERLKALAEAFDAERLRQDEALAQEVLALALAVARQILRTGLQVRPELILPVLREALANLPTLTGHTRLLVHPQHAALVREFLASEHVHLSWKVVEDASLEPGGFRIENAHGELDARIETRWQDIVKALGADTAWIDRTAVQP